MKIAVNRVLKNPNINILVAIFFLLVSIFLYKEAVLNGKMVWGQDTPKIVYPLAKLLDQSFKSHKFTLWTPDIYFGFPIGAEQGQYGLFYPPNLLHAVLPFITSITVLSIFHFFLAAVATYAFSRLLKISRTGSVLAALAFMLNGFILSHQQYLSHVYSYAYLPVEMFFVEFALQRKRLWPFTLAGSFLGLQFLTGHPNIAVMSAIALGIYIPIRVVIETSKHSKLLYLLKIAVLIFIPLLLVSLPYSSQLKTLLPLSIRANGVDFQDATNSSISPYDFITLIFPNFFFGSLKSTWAFASTWHFWGYWGQIETTGYVGILTVVLFIISFSKKNLKRFLPFYAILLVSVLIGLGKNTPLYSNIFFKIPIFNGLRAPGKFFYLIDFSLAVLAAISFDEFISIKNKVKLLVVAFFPILLLTITLAANLIFRFYPNQVYNLIDDGYSKLGYVPDLNDKNVLLGSVSYSLSNQTVIGIILSFLFAFILINLYRTKSVFFKILLILLVTFDLLYFALDINVWSSPANFPGVENPTIQN